MPSRDISDRESQHFDSLRPIVRFRPLLASFPTAIEVSVEPAAASHRTDSPTTTVLIDERLQSFVLTDQDRKDDTFAMTFIDDHGVFTEESRLVHGAMLGVSFGYRGRMSDERALIVRRLKIGAVQGRKWGQKRRGFLVTFEGLGPGMIANREPSSAYDVFENVKPSRVMREVAQRIQKDQSRQGGPPLDVVIDVPAAIDVSRALINRQSTETDKQFLIRLATEYGLNVHFDSSSGIRVGPEREDAPAQYEVDIDGDTLLGFDLDGNLMIPLPGEVQSLGWNATTRQVALVAARLDSKDKKHHKGGSAPQTMQSHESASEASTPDTDGGLVESAPISEVAGPQSVLAEGAGFILGTKRLGRGTDSAVRKSNLIIVDARMSTSAKAGPHTFRHLRKRIKKAWKLRVRIVGDPTARAGRTVNLKNFGTPYLDGLWYISEVRHTIDAGGYVTEMQCRRPPGANASAAGNLDVGLVATNQDTDKSAAKDKIELREGGGFIKGKAADVAIKRYTRGGNMGPPPASPSKVVP